MEDLGSLSVAALFGAALWEGGKQLFGVFLKRKAEQTESKRKLLREDIATASERVTSCLRDAAEYYTLAPSDTQRQALARTVTHSVKILAQDVRNMNIGLQELGLDGLDNGLLISFRKAVTTQLDSAALPQLSPDDPAISGMYRAGQHLQLAFTQLRYSAA